MIGDNRFAKRQPIYWIAVFCLCFTTHRSLCAQSWKPEIGYTLLQSEVGAALPSGSGIRASQVEANVGSGGSILYAPNPSNSQFSGKTIIDGTGSSTGFSGHATSVGAEMYGNTSSIAGGTSNITAYWADNWVDTHLGFTSGNDPVVENVQVQNHSYIGNGLTVADAVNLTERLDYMIERDNVLSFVAANNGSTSAIPQLFTNSYNAIAVGRSDGAHSHGLTTIYGVGRVKPDVVIPAGSTSIATARASSVGILLSDKASLLGNTDAQKTEVLKAAIMAGATKDEFPSWSNTTTRPLDLTYGAGEVNVYNSYKILEGGEHDGSLTAPSSTITLQGWDYGESIAAGNEKYYDFQTNGKINELSLLLTWNANITDTNPGIGFNPTFALANMTLKLFNSTGGFLNSLVGISNSSVDNVEHIYLKNLAAGHYTIAVSTDLTTDYGLAWNISAVPEPSSLFALSSVAVGLIVHRRFKRCNHKRLD